MSWSARRWAGEFGPIPHFTVADDDPADLGLFTGPVPLPKNRRGVYQVFGNPGSGTVDRKWERRSMVVARNLPGDWNSGKGKLYTHRLAEPHLREALRRCDVLGCLEEIRRLGCFNFRHQRHDTKRPLSYHSWGIAVDINGGDNAPNRYQDGEKPELWSPEWRRVWPDGVSSELVTAFQGAGWTWGGVWTRFCDPMHFELVR